MTFHECIVQHLMICFFSSFQELLDQVINFQKEAQDALNAETPDSEKLEQLIEFSATMDVDLVEIPRLKQVWQRSCQLCPECH